MLSSNFLTCFFVLVLSIWRMNAQIIPVTISEDDKNRTADWRNAVNKCWQTYRVSNKPGRAIRCVLTASKNWKAWYQVSRILFNPTDVHALSYTARLDIGKRFKKTNITQTVPNVSSYVPWMPEKYWINHCKAHFFIIKHLNVQT